MKPRLPLLNKIVSKDYALRCRCAFNKTSEATTEKLPPLTQIVETNFARCRHSGAERVHVHIRCRAQKKLPNKIDNEKFVLEKNKPRARLTRG
ncbi:MAG: hypothetical protein EBT43_06805 [Methylocystaceae bacterium]|nr:hypothetical protein [Methylocystaceae bacterium]